MKYMRLEDINIKDSFANSVPKKEKVNVCRKHWDKNHEQDRYIVVNRNNFLIDGYIQYLVLKENNVDVAEVKVSDRKRKKWTRKNQQLKVRKINNKNYRERETTYIYGVHPNSKSIKERVWRVPNSWWDGWADSLSIGDMIWVNTKYGIAPIEITRIERSGECPVSIPVKTVVRKIRNEEDIDK